MNINGVSPSYLGTQTWAAKRADASADQQASGSEPAPAGAKLLSGIHILSRVETTVPDGRTLSLFRFDLGTSGVEASSAAPTPEDRRNDAAMLAELKQLAAYFNFKPSASDIKLEGTAAKDLTA